MRRRPTTQRASLRDRFTHVSDRPALADVEQLPVGFAACVCAALPSAASRTRTWAPRAPREVSRQPPQSTCRLPLPRGIDRAWYVVDRGEEDPPQRERLSQRIRQSLPSQLGDDRRELAHGDIRVWPWQRREEALDPDE